MIYLISLEQNFKNQDKFRFQDTILVFKIRFLVIKKQKDRLL